MVSMGRRRGQAAGVRRRAQVTDEGLSDPQPLLHDREHRDETDARLPVRVRDVAGVAHAYRDRRGASHAAGDGTWQERLALLRLNPAATTSTRRPRSERWTSSR